WNSLPLPPKQYSKHDFSSSPILSGSSYTRGEKLASLEIAQVAQALLTSYSRAEVCQSQQAHRHTVTPSHHHRAPRNWSGCTSGLSDQNQWLSGSYLVRLVCGPIHHGRRLRTATRR